MAETGETITASDLRNANTMPSGYCPHCEYPMNPGVCPECGARVTAGTLDSRPVAIRRRTRRRRIVIAAVIIVVLPCVIQLYETRFWYPWLPTPTLIAWAPESRWARNEILRRFLDGLLTEEETYKAGDMFATVSPEIRSPHPSRETIWIRLDVTPRGYGFGMDIAPAELPRILIDGQVTRVAESKAEFADITPHGYKLIYQCTVDDPLRSGKHSVEGVLPYVFLTHRGQVPVPLRFTCEFNVDDKPLSEFVRPMDDDASEMRLKQQCTVSICPRDGRDFSVNLCVRQMKLPLVGHVEVRLDVQSDPIAESRFHTDATDKLDSHDIRFTLPDDMNARETTIHVRFIPDLLLGFERDYTSCAAFTIEWVGVPLPVPEDEACDVCSCCKNPFVRSPDVVRRWTPPAETRNPKAEN